MRNETATRPRKTRTRSAFAVFACLLAPALATAEPATTTAEEQAACSGEGVVAEAVAVRGAVFAQAPGKEKRSLSCDGAVYACETVTTAPGASVALLGEDLYVQLDGDAAARVGEDGDAPKVFLDQGWLRVLPGDAPVLVVTRHASFEAREADVEFSLQTRATGPYARACVHGGDLGVWPAGEGDALDLGEGACVEAEAHHAQPRPGQAPVMAAASPLACGLPDLAVELLPFDVSAGPSSDFPEVRTASHFLRRPCDGSSCFGVPQGPPPVRPPPTRPPTGPPVGPPPVPPASVPPTVTIPPPSSTCGGPGFGCP